MKPSYSFCTIIQSKNRIDGPAEQNRVNPPELDMGFWFVDRVPLTASRRHGRKGKITPDWQVASVMSEGTYNTRMALGVGKPRDLCPCPPET